MTVTLAEQVIVGGSSSPWTSPELWDSIVLGGASYGWGGSPLSASARVGGKVRVHKAKRKYKLDIKDQQGADGATTTYRGVRPQRFDITFYIWTADQYDYFVQEVIPALLYSGIKNAANPAGIQALAIQYPSLENIGITSVIVEHVGAIEPQEDGPGMYTCVVSVAEYLPAPPTNTTSTPAGSKGVNQPTSPGLQPSSAVLQRQAAVAALKAQVAAAAAAP